MKWMASMSHVHWIAPVGMAGALFAGFFFALGHHLFYSSLAGTPAPTGEYRFVGTNVSRQQLNTAIGTAFAFLVKSLLTVTISIAFAQAFWRAIRTSRKGTTLKSLDHTYSLLNNFLGLRDVDVWKAFPVPLALAFIGWCIPLASIITPATLSVHSSPITPAPSHMAKVPNLDFSSLNYAAPIPEGTEGFCFDGPSQTVERVVAAVAAQGKILPISAPGANTSWNVPFWGPSLKCNDVGGTERTEMFNHILDHYGTVDHCSNAHGYLAWVPTLKSHFPFVRHGTNDTKKSLEAASMAYGAPAAIYVATLPQMFNFAFMSSNSLTGEKCRFFGADSLIYSYPIADDLCLPGVTPPFCYGQQAFFSDATLLKCELLNSSHLVEFKYVEGAQTINVTTGHEAASVPVTPHECFVPGNSGDSKSQNLQCNGTGTGGVCRFDEVASKLISYQGIAQAFNQLLLGSITIGGYGTPKEGATSKTPGITSNSYIDRTMLIDTEELAFVLDFNGVNHTFNNLQTEVSKSDNAAYRGITSNFPTGRRGDLKSALEMLFQNITISLLSEEYLQPNYSSPYAPAEMREVAFNRYHNVYVYSARTLWLAYGLAIFFTMVALGLGVRSMILNNATFINDFSTILRTSRAAPMNKELREIESNGQQPLPKRLVNARIFMGSSRSSLQTEDSKSSLTEERELATIDSMLLS